MHPLQLSSFSDVTNFSKRGIVFLQGLGDMGTFWLLGKEKFPYKIDLERAGLRVATSTYWKNSNTQENNGNLLV